MPNSLFFFNFIFPRLIVSGIKAKKTTLFDYRLLKADNDVLPLKKFTFPIADLFLCSKMCFPVSYLTFSATHVYNMQFNNNENSNNNATSFDEDILRNDKYELSDIPQDDIPLPGRKMRNLAVNNQCEYNNDGTLFIVKQPSNLSAVFSQVMSSNDDGDFETNWVSPVQCWREDPDQLSPMDSNLLPPAMGTPVTSPVTPLLASPVYSLGEKTNIESPNKERLKGAGVSVFPLREFSTNRLVENINYFDKPSFGISPMVTTWLHNPNLTQRNPEVIQLLSVSGLGRFIRCFDSIMMTIRAVTSPENNGKDIGLVRELGKSMSSYNVTNSDLVLLGHTINAAVRDNWVEADSAAWDNLWEAICEILVQESTEEFPSAPISLWGWWSATWQKTTSTKLLPPPNSNWGFGWGAANGVLRFCDYRDPLGFLNLSYPLNQRISEYPSALHHWYCDNLPEDESGNAIKSSIKSSSPYLHPDEVVKIGSRGSFTDLLSILYSKFMENIDLREALLATEGLLLTYHSEDRILGDGHAEIWPSDKSGDNMLGILLMEVRDRVREDLGGLFGSTSLYWRYSLNNKSEATQQANWGNLASPKRHGYNEDLRKENFALKAEVQTLQQQLTDKISESESYQTLYENSSDKTKRLEDEIKGLRHNQRVAVLKTKLLAKENEELQHQLTVMQEDPPPPPPPLSPIDNQPVSNNEGFGVVVGGQKKKSSKKEKEPLAFMTTAPQRPTPHTPSPQHACIGIYPVGSIAEGNRCQSKAGKQSAYSYNQWQDRKPLIVGNSNARQATTFGSLDRFAPGMRSYTGMGDSHPRCYTGVGDSHPLQRHPLDRERRSNSAGPRGR